MRRVGLAMLLLLPCRWATAAEPAAFRALVIGINDYRDRFIPDLRYAGPDARAVAGFLAARAGAAERVALLTDTAAAPLQPTRAGLHQQLVAAAASLQPEATVVFYFAGHGVNVDDEDYLVPQDADLKDRESVLRTCLPVAEVIGALSAAPARQVLFIVDACRDTGRNDTSVFGTALRIASTGGDQANQVRATLSAARPGQQAYEWQEVGHGVFTWYLLEGWQGAAADAEGNITVESLARHVQRQVKAWMEKEFGAKRSQLPWLLKDGVAPLVLGRREATSTITVAFENTPLRQAMEEVARQAGYDLLLAPGVPVDKPLTARLNGRSLAAALAAILKPAGLDYTVEDQILVVKAAAGSAPTAPARVARPAGRDGMPLVLVPGGSYARGSDQARLLEVMQLPADGPPLAEWMFWNELSDRPVAVDSYWLDEHEVTNQQYRRFVEAGGYRAQEFWSEAGWAWLREAQVAQPLAWDDPARRADPLPVAGVSYYEAEAYARWAGRRLPTEAEWEYAGQGGRGHRFDYGDEFAPHRASIGLSGPVAVMSHPANPFGLFDLSGNVAEWCADIFDPDFYRWGELLNPICVTNLRVDQPTPRRSVRGGGYAADAIASRVRRRSSAAPDERRLDLGFRCAADLAAVRKEL